MHHNGDTKEENRRKNRLLFLLLLCILTLELIIVIMLILKEKYNAEQNRIIVSSGNSGKGVELEIDPNAESGAINGSGSMDEQGVAIFGRQSMIIPTGKKDVKADFSNPEENAGLYYLTFELRLYDNDNENYEVLYTSGLIEPGMHVERITLSRRLEKGVYQAVLHVQPYRMNEERTLTNNADIMMELIVE